MASKNKSEDELSDKWTLAPHADEKEAAHPKQGAKTKKSSKKEAPEANTRNQARITNYFNSNSATTTYEAASDPEQTRIALLKEELEAKNELITKIRTQKEIFENKYSVLHMECRSFTSKAKEIMIKALTAEYERKRREKGKISEQLGNFSANNKHFIHGEKYMRIETVIREREQEIQKLESELKKCKSNDQKDRILFSIAFIKKQISGKSNQKNILEKEVNLYKNRIKLSQKQTFCFYATKNWPLIKDSRNNERYLPLELLGQGGFGEVYKCFDLDELGFVALKISILKFPERFPSGEQHPDLRHIKRQVETQIQLNHPNIARIKQIIESKNDSITFILEYCEGPQLSLYLREHKCLEEREARGVMYQIFSALNYLNEGDKKIIHYDLKPSNIMFHRGVIKVLDFGLCKVMESYQSELSLTSPGAGTYYYLPPETFSREFRAKISGKVDVWSAGVIFYELLYGQKPFAHGESQEKIIQEDLIVKNSKKLKFPIETPKRYKVSQKAKEFIELCLEVDVDKRLSPSQAYNHSYFKS